MVKKENTYLSTIQWFIFLLANSIALPIVIGNIYQLSDYEIATFMQRMFLVVGLSSMLQARLGHKFPIADGPAGSWVSIFVIYATVSFHNGNTFTDTLQILQTGIIVSGIIMLLLGITRWVRHFLFLFTPVVMSTFLIILAIQLSNVFFSGIASPLEKNSTSGIIEFLIAILIFSLILFLNIRCTGWLKSYAILIGIVAGWLAFFVIGSDAPEINYSSQLIEIPKLFAWGLPKFDVGIVITAVLFTFLLLSNTVAAISAAEEVSPNRKQSFNNRLYNGTTVGGVSHLIAAFFSTIPAVPLPATAGYMKLTRQYRTFPFIFACAILILTSLFPKLVGFLASLPLPIASAALLATLIKMLEIAFKPVMRKTLSERNLTIVSISMLIAIGMMFLPDGTFAALPELIQPIISNGLLIGTIIAIALDVFWKVEK